MTFKKAGKMLKKSDIFTLQIKKKGCWEVQYQVLPVRLYEVKTPALERKKVIELGDYG